MLRRLRFLLPLACFAAAPAAAQSATSCGLPGKSGNGTIQNASSGLTAGTYVTFDFNGQPNQTNASLLTGSLTKGNVTISGVTGAYFGKYNTVPYAGFPYPDDALYNFGGTGITPSTSPSFTFQFASAVTGVAFNFLNGLGDATFKVYKSGQGGDQQVGSIVTPLATIQVVDLTDDGTYNPLPDYRPAVCWWGFEFGPGTTFDKLVVSGDPRTFALDNLQVTAPTTVPEPSTVALTTIGLAGLLLTARRRSKK